jgi:hypothetical protein
MSAMIGVQAHHEQTGSLLIEALPYIQRFAGKTVVVKYGGNALAGASDADAAGTFAQDIALLHAVGIRPVVVHGGGPQISAMMERLGKKAEFRNGLRVTDAETIEIASMVLLGTVNPQLVSAINVHGGQAVGVSGQDAGLLKSFSAIRISASSVTSSRWIRPCCDRRLRTVRCRSSPQSVPMPRVRRTT